VTPRTRRSSSAGTQSPTVPDESSTPFARRDLPAVPGLEVLAELDRTAESAVYQVRRNDNDYTLTLLAPSRPGKKSHKSPDRAAVMRALRRRVTRLAGIDLPGLPRVHEVGEFEDRPFLVTDFVPGRPLTEMVAGNPLSVRHALTLALDLAFPLAAMHRRGLVHGDVTPRNIIVLDDGTARLTDVGLVGSRRGSSLMGTRTAIGTLAYAAPEQSRSLARPADSRSDLYSLGVVLFECLTGTLPFVASDPAELLRLHAETPAPDPRSAGAEVGDTVAAVLATLLAKDPDRRYPTAEALATDLQRLLDDPQRSFAPGRSGPSGAGRHRTITSALAGRDRELGLLTDLWDQARQGEGQSCLLRGAAGVGTSRLAGELVQLARRAAAPVLLVPCGDESPVPFAPLRRALENLLREAQGWPTGQRSDLYDRIRTAAGPAAPLLAGLSPALATLLDARPPADGDRAEAFAGALARFIGELATLSGGLLLVCDDSELVDPATLRVLSHLAGALPDLPLLWIGTGRIDRPIRTAENPLLPSLRAAIDLDLVLEPLTEAGAKALIEAELPGLDPASALVRPLLAHGRGNPLGLLEQLRAVIDAGGLRPHWGSWVIEDGGLEALIPATEPLELLAQRISRLEQRNLLAAAAVIGQRFSPDVVAEVREVDVDVVLGALAQAAGEQLVEPAGGGDYTFTHPRVSAALLEAETSRLALHRSIAKALDQRYQAAEARRSTDATRTIDDRIYPIAEHYRIAGVPGSSRTAERAFTICRAAGRQALLANAPGLAVTWLEHAAAVRPDDARVQHTLGTALYRNGQYRQARPHLEKALAGEPDRQRRARTLLQLTEVHRTAGNIGEAIGTMEWGLAEVKAALPRLRVLRAFSALRIAIVLLFVRLTGFGFGSARDERRTRAHLVLALHRAGAELAAIRLRSGTLVLHELHAARAAARLGHGSDYSLAQAGNGLAAARFGRRRLTERKLRQAELAAAELADPQLTARIAWSAGAARYLGGADNGESWARVASRRGLWLDTRQYAETIETLCWEAAVQGRNEDVQRWHEKGRRQAAFGPEGQFTAMATVNALRLASVGQCAEASAELDRVHSALDRQGDSSLQVKLALTEMYVLAEAGDLDQRFEVAAAQFFSFGLPQAGMLRPHRWFLVLHARGRLALCRRARTPEALKVRLTMARTAVKQLRAVANTPLLLATYQQCKAELMLLEGHPERALAMLGRILPQPEKAPLLGFEIHRTTARAMLAVSFPADADRQIRSALALAETHSWSARRRAIELEFAVQPAPAPSSAREKAQKKERSTRAVRRQRDLADLLRGGSPAPKRTTIELNDPPVGGRPTAAAGAGDRVADLDELAESALDSSDLDEDGLVEDQPAEIEDDGLDDVGDPPDEADEADEIEDDDEPDDEDPEDDEDPDEIEDADELDDSEPDDELNDEDDEDELDEGPAAAPADDLAGSLIEAVGWMLPAARTWLIQPASRAVDPGSATPAPAQVTFGAQLPEPGQSCELIFDPELRSVAAGGQAVVGSPDSIVPPQLRRLLAGSASWLLLPLTDERAVFGVLVLSSDQPGAFTEAEVPVLQTLVNEQLQDHRNR
jgi:tRNA A-37 threonylcarbamoyl transferase component Bud32/tetratricopeptide (TPR) repeat protein